MADDPRYQTEAARLAAAADLEDLVAAWTAGQRAEDVAARLQRRGVPAHVAATSADWSRDPQLAHRGHLRALPDEQFGTATVEGPRYLLSDTPGEVRAQRRGWARTMSTCCARCSAMTRPPARG